MEEQLMKDYFTVSSLRTISVSVRRRSTRGFGLKGFQLIKSASSGGLRRRMLNDKTVIERGINLKSLILFSTTQIFS